MTKISHTKLKHKIWPDIVKNSSKIVNLLDMCGHEKYLKATMRGLTSENPDYCLLTIGANMGISMMTKKHIMMTLALDLPSFCVLTKTDVAPENIRKQNLEKIKKIIKESCKKIPKVINTMKDVEETIKLVQNGAVSPIFYISNKTGENVDLLKRFLYLLPKRD